jgi:hypothetical protein
MRANAESRKMTYLSEILASNLEIPRKRAKILCIVIHECTAAEYAQDLRSASTHMLDASAAIDSLKSIRAEHGDVATDSVGRAEKLYAEIAVLLEGKWL